MELDHRPRAPIPTDYGASRSSPQTDNDMRPRLPTRKYKLRRERESAAAATSSASGSALTSEQQDGRIQRNIEVSFCPV